MFGALPVGFQPFQGATHAFVGDRHRDDALLQADLGDQFQGPGATVFAEFARAAVQQILQAFQSFFRERGAQSMGTRRSLTQYVETRSIETMDHIAYHLIVAAELAGKLWGSFFTGGGQQDLAAAQDKGI